MTQDPHRGEDVLNNKVQAMVDESDGNLTWDEACDIVADDLDANNLNNSADHVRSLKVVVDIAEFR